MSLPAIRKIFFIVATLGILALGGFFTAEAQTGGNCHVTNAIFRITRNPFNLATFYTDANRPEVYVDFNTTNCVGQSIQVSITEEDAGPDDDIAGGLGSLDPCNANYNSCMRQRSIQVPTDNFSISLQAGTDECENGSPECRYYLRTWDAVNSSHEWHTGTRLVDGSVQNAGSSFALAYNCNGSCGTFWTYQGLLSSFGGTNSNDIDVNSGTGTQTTGPDSGTNTTGPDGGTPTTGTATTAPTVIDLNLVNPLAGTVDTIPQFFQKIVEIIIKIAIPIVAMAIVYSGLLFVTARGDEGKLKTAKNAFFFAVIGGLILLASWLVADAIRDALTTL